MSVVAPPLNGQNGGGGGSSVTYLAFSDATEINTSGKIADGDSNAIDFTIDNGQAAAVNTNGLSGLIGAALWDRGTVSGSAPITLLVTLESMPTSSRFCLAIGIGTVPTSLATIKSGNPYFLEVQKRAGDQIDTRCKVGTASLLASGSGAEATTTSHGITLQVAADDIGYGPGHVSHLSTKSGTKRRDTHDQASKLTHTSGNLWIAALWGKSATASAEETLSVKIEVKS